MTSPPGGMRAPGSAGLRLGSLAHRVIFLRGWRRLAVAWAAGALGAFAMPPFGVLPALVVSLTLAVWLIDGAGSGAHPWRAPRKAFVIGWTWGFGYFTAGLWWLGSAFLVEAEQFAWALPLGVLGLPAVLALFTGAGFAAARLLWSRGALRLLALGFGFAAAEWLRGHLFTGFPWNTLGMALGGHLWTMQAASLVGLYGLSLIVVPIAAAPATLATGATARARYGPALAAVAALVALAVFGVLRLPAQADPTVPGVKLRLIQPAVPQDERYERENRDAIVDSYIALSTGEGWGEVTHAIWPESAFPFLIQRDPEALGRIGAAIPEGKFVVTGAARAQEPLTRTHAVFYNSILTIGHEASLGDQYDKVHLVPFGEYLPEPFDATLRALGVRQFVATPGGFTAGSRAGQRILTVPGLPPIAATICYEAIFPGAIVPAEPSDGAHNEPGLILNLTNDAWFGRTPGPYQHFAQARLRAVEEGLPLVRDANNGISAVVDPHGRVLASLPLGAQGVLDSALPERLPGATLYRQFGDLPFAALMAVAFGLALSRRWRERRA